MFSHLFQYNLIELIQKGVDMAPIFRSNVFLHEFDYTEWPSTSEITDTVLAPYNNSAFKLRFEYKNIYKDLASTENAKYNADFADNQVIDNVYFKIKYQVNLLPAMSTDEGSLMEAIAGSDELDIFNTEAVQILVDFKWQQFALRTHSIGAISHVCYMCF